MGLLGRSCFLAFLVDWAPHCNHHHTDICQSLSSFGFRFLSHTSNRLTCIALRSVCLLLLPVLLRLCLPPYHTIAITQSFSTPGHANKPPVHDRRGCGRIQASIASLTVAFRLRIDILWPALTSRHRLLALRGTRIAAPLHDTPTRFARYTTYAPLDASYCFSSSPSLTPSVAYNIGRLQQ